MDKKLLDKLNGFNLSMQQKMSLVELIQEASGGDNASGGGIKVKTIYYYPGEGADSNNLYLKIDDIVIQNPPKLEGSINGISITNQNVFTKCYNYIKERYIFDYNGGEFTVLNVNISYSDNTILFTTVVDTCTFYIVITNSN